MSETKEADRRNIYQRLLNAQGEIVAPRQTSRFKSGSRSAEQILEAVKPVCRKHGLFVHTTEEVEVVGPRIRIKATATVVNVDNPEEQLSASASAWEGDVSAGLDTSQVSGKTGSYSKKYALQHLFAIDDTKDADFEHHEPSVSKEPAPTPKASDPSSDALTRAKQQINGALTASGYDTPAAKLAFIKTVLGHETIDNLNEADRIADKLGMEDA